MSKSKREAPDPIKGETYRTSKAKVLVIGFFSLLMIVVGGFFAWARFIREDLPTDESRITLWGGIVGLVMLLLGPLGVAATVLALVRPKAIVFGRRAFQVVKFVGGKRQVVTHIPYENVKRVTVANDEGDKHLDVILRNADDEASFTDEDPFDVKYKYSKYHFRIDNQYQISLGDMREIILDAVDAISDGEAEADDRKKKPKR